MKKVGCSWEQRDGRFLGGSELWDLQTTMEESPRYHFWRTPERGDECQNVSEALAGQ